MKDLIKVLKTKNKVKFVDLIIGDDIINLSNLSAFNELIEGHKKAMIFNDLNNKLIELSNIVQNGFNQINSRLDRIEQRLDNLEKDVIVLKEDVALIKECPTIKKELKHK